MVAIAERLGIRRVATFVRRRIAVFRPRLVQTFDPIITGRARL
jgi:hypothetical protein